MKIKKNIYISVLLIFMIYMFSADYIFNTLFTINNESSRVSIELPNATNDIQMYIDTISEKQIQWKEIISIEGWAFKKNSKKEGEKRYIVLHSEKACYVFDINNNIKVRRDDVADHFNIDNHFTGFTALIAKDTIKEGSYRLGIAIEDEEGKQFVLSKQYLTKKNDRIISGFLSSQMKLSIGESNRKVKYAIDSIECQEEYIRIRGWGFIEGMDAHDIQHYIILKKDHDLKIFDTATQTRKDVTDHFKDCRLDLDNSGFEAVIPRDMLTSSEYQLGLYIVIGNQQGVILLDTYINNNAEDLK